MAFANVIETLKKGANMERRFPLSILALVAVGCFGWVRVAKAQWSAEVTGPDVFGNTTVVASTSNDSGNRLVVQCNQSDTLDLAYIMPGTASELDELSKSGVGVPAQLLLKIDSGQVMKFSAQLQQWNNTYIGFVASGRTADIVNAVNAIGKGADQISVGALLMGNQQSDTFDVVNSTSAMSTVTTDCKLGGIQAGTNDPDPKAH